MFFGFFYVLLPLLKRKWRRPNKARLLCLFEWDLWGFCDLLNPNQHILSTSSAKEDEGVPQEVCQCAAVLERHSQCKIYSSRGVLEPDSNWNVPKFSRCPDKNSKSDSHFSPAPILEGSYWCQQDVGQPEITPFLREAASVSKTHPRVTGKLISHICCHFLCHSGWLLRTEFSLVSLYTTSQRM